MRSPLRRALRCAARPAAHSLCDPHARGHICAGAHMRIPIAPLRAQGIDDMMIA